MPFVFASHQAGYPAGLSSPHHTNPGRWRRASRDARQVHSAKPLMVRSRVARMPTRSMVWEKRPSLAALSGYRPVETTSECGAYRSASSPIMRAMRSEEHTSELQSLAYLRFRLLL